MALVKVKPTSAGRRALVKAVKLFPFGGHTDNLGAVVSLGAAHRET